MEKITKKLALFWVVILCVSCVPFSAFATSLSDNLVGEEYDLAWKNLSYVIGQEYAETGATCPKCGASLRKIDQGTCPSCGYNALIVDEDGKITYKTGGGSAGTGGVGRPKAYKEDNTPAVTSSGLYTMYVHPTFIRFSTGRPFVSGTQNSMSQDGVIQENNFFTTTLETNRVSVSFSCSDDVTFQINSKVYYKITAPVTGHYEFKDWNYKDVKCGGSFQALDTTLSIKLGEINLSKGNTEETLYFQAISNAISNGQFTYLYAPDLVVKYTPFNERTNSYQPLEKKTSITANGKEITGTIYHDPENNYYYAYDDNDNCTVYVQNKKGDVIGDISYDQTENIYITNIYPGATTGEDEADESPDIMTILVQIRDNMIQGFADLKATLVQGWADLSANFTLAIENLNLNITNIFNKKFPDQSTSETAQPSPSPSPSPEPVDPILPDTQNYIIPKMNSNTFADGHGTWIASGSSKYSDVFDFFHAFDRSTSDFWETNVSPSYLQIEIPDPENYYIDGYIMRISKFDNRYPKDWTLQGSDDGETWDDLDTQAGQNLSDKAEHKYTLTLRKAYKYYRVNMSNYASSMCSLSHFNLLGYDAKDVVTPTPSPSPTPDPGTDPTPAPTDKPSNGNTNNFWNFVFPGGNDDGTENGHKGILWALISLLIAVVTFVLGLGNAYSYVFPFLPAGLVTTIHICVLVLLLFAIIKFVRSFL